MRVATDRNEWMKRRLGDAAVIAVLALGYLLWGCDKPGYDGRAEKRTSVAEQPTSRPVVVTPASYEQPAPTPEPVVRTTPITFDEAEQAFRELRYEDAVLLFTAYVGRKPDNPWGHYMLGLSAWKAGDYLTAESAFEEALSDDPRHVKSLLGLGRVLIETDRSDEAIQEIEFALEIDPASGQAWRLMGRALHELGRVDEAIATYLDAIALDEHDVWSMNNLGYVYIQHGRFVDALGPLARAVELAPDVAVFQNNLGIALERAGYVGSAAEAFRAALVADETYEKAAANLRRVEQRGTDLDITADLTAIAQRFTNEVGSWRGLAVGHAELDTLPPDSLPDPKRQPDRQ
ncbi:MAG: tetratricopeptide repeat protein [Gemmatimonadales bacterium]|nr:tetratricopeptide repeat protein [Gemmatimonadales bacterium]NIN11181.1 tetratricopeptide repeat protein [Gemmatimonadales bacterium]NIN49780.1 tetratricopeptide repeat protein [Gemmatimonadales bacterium]NIP07244.1 tetratricopeptide repeat protein [Gemmatimonadales bacterium]NIR00457.1 tetratricopeptide repeat protein [Gemmatimonadales bacterium]